MLTQQQHNQNHQSKSTSLASQLYISTPIVIPYTSRASQSLFVSFTHTLFLAMRKPHCYKESTNKGAWSKQEDQKLIDYIQVHGEGCWSSIPKAAGLYRCGKSCRLRWLNFLRPDIKHGVFGQDEEDLIIKLHALLGNRWSLIAGRLPGRTDNEVKNYWNSHIRRKLINMGIDPNNHKLHVHHPDPAASSASSSVSMKIDHRVYPYFKSYDAANEVLFSKCCHEEETTMVSSSNLNLDLTIALPSPRLDIVEDKPKPNSESRTKRREDMHGYES
ncbi:hypothetical protein Lal_00048390 [Lupinus albus]|uniref:Putative transcription factor MYB-HB-like family n=1 Tax=Lupinus albus TaxID=3870 RepID=A0A6A5MC40_LUPAL|nr:putative transcription factor MYB-HB-like family [Lupinus albus]KAF1869110.1 hypothetical protein Lal_00048390 [Lupinus albus]